jgi:hypothetical protein
MDDDEGDDIIEDDESDSDGADGGYNFHNLLTAWAVTWGIKQKNKFLYLGMNNT